jgi:hypothetical protein
MPNRLLAAVVLVTLGAATPAAGQAAGWNYSQAGGLIGGAAFFALARAGAAACGIGCENDMPIAGELAVAGLGAGIGALAGLTADILRGNDGPAFALSAGPIVSQITTQSPAMTGSARGAGATVVFQLSRLVSVHAEYTALRGAFTARPGTIDPGVIDNFVPATDRSAGWSRGMQRSRVDSVFSEMIGFHPRQWRRVRVEVLAGVSIRAQENFDYYDDLPGKYKILNFAAPDLGAVVGGNAEIAVTRRLAVVPMVRYYTGNNPGPSIGYTVGARYRF